MDGYYYTTFYPRVVPDYTQQAQFYRRKCRSFGCLRYKELDGDYCLIHTKCKYCSYSIMYYEKHICAAINVSNGEACYNYKSKGPYCQDCRCLLCCLCPPYLNLLIKHIYTFFHSIL